MARQRGRWGPVPSLRTVTLPMRAGLCTPLRSPAFGEEGADADAALRAVCGLRCWRPFLSACEMAAIVFYAARGSGASSRPVTTFSISLAYWSGVQPHSSVRRRKIVSLAQVANRIAAAARGRGRA